MECWSYRNVSLILLLVLMKITYKKIKAGSNQMSLIIVQSIYMYIVIVIYNSTAIITNLMYHFTGVRVMNVSQYTMCLLDYYRQCNVCVLDYNQSNRT